MSAKLVKVHSPKNEMELIFIKSILEGENIPFYVQNDYFGSLILGPQIEHIDQRTIFVPEEYKDQVQDIIKNLDETTEVTGGKLTWLDHVLLAFEGLFFMWFVPGRRRKKKDVGEEE